MKTPIPLDFDTPDLSRRVEQLTEEQIHSLAFGAIRMGRSGLVEMYSRREAQLAGNLTNTIGRSFFEDIAPCMNTVTMRGRIEKALDHGTLDLEMLHIGDFCDRGRAIRIRAQPSAQGGYWLFLLRED